MESVYIETSVISYLSAYPSRDLVVAAHQQITRDWWRTVRERFELYISELVLAEIRAGDPEAGTKRLGLIQDIAILEQTEDVGVLVRHYDKTLGLTGRARADIPHFAFAVSYEMDYLVTWNCSHIANGQMIKRLIIVNNELKRRTPLIVTPEEILETLEGQ